MKRIFCLTVLIFVAFARLSAQEEMGFDSKFAAGGGFTPGWIFPNFDAINEKLPSLGIEKLPSSGIFATGGTGFISIPFIKNLRIGGMGFGGSVKKTSVVNRLSREVDYSTSMGGFTAEYTMPFIKNIALSVGFIFGGGSNTIEVYENQVQENWDKFWGEDFNIEMPQSGNSYKKLTNKHLMIAPTINIDIPIYRFFAFRIGGGYKFALSESWEYNNEQTLNNIPSNLKSNLLFLQAGIFIGFFNY
jgi:hypothetical protein